MKLSKVILLAGAAYLVIKNRDKIVAKAQQIGLINVVTESTNEQAQKSTWTNDLR